MIKFYKYLFSKAYYFCINVFKEKEFPWAWAGGTVGFMIITNIIVVLDLIQYQLLPGRINIDNNYYKYFAVGWVGIAWVWVKYKNRYLKILNEYDGYSNNLKRVFRVLSILYYLLLIYLFFYTGELGRNYNQLHD